MQQEKQKFKLAHIALYAKGWYQKTDNIYADLKKILVLDGYTPFSNNDVFIILSNHFEKSDLHPHNSLQRTIQSITRDECWKCGYYTRDHKWVKNHESLPEYDMEIAFIHYVLSSIRNTEMDKIQSAIPKYGKENKRPDHIPLKRVIEMFNK